MLRIAVVAEDYFTSQVFLAAMVHDTVNDIVKIGTKNINIHISEEGHEVAYDSDSIVIALRSSKRADSYSLMNALNDPYCVPQEELKLSVRTFENFFGRAHFISVGADENKNLSGVDGALFIVESHFSDEMNRIAQSCVFDGIPVTVAVMCKNESEYNNGIADKALGVLDKDMKLCPFAKYIGWYNPYGFAQNEQLSPESAAPLGIQPLFWSVLRGAAGKKADVLSAAMHYSEKVIKSRASIFQKSSIRRNIELNNARKAYSKNGAEIITVENMLDLANEYFNEGGAENEA